ncbi:hypothetical protein AB0L80_07685 [Streptomyces sp. NPDC052069]|uniref:hypothetical protein n=1 Tax=Streptomyces sp. NPDC052069 TaxID=3154650 RepID=UPI0034216424
MSASKRDALTAAVALLGALPMPVGTMPEPMTSDREREIRAREQAATPGPWESDGAEIYGTLGGVLMVDLWVGETLDVEDQQRSNADAAFMADARSAVPELLAEVVRLRARVAELEGQADCPSQMTVSSGTSRCALPVRHGGDHRTAEKNHHWSDEYADAARVRPTEDPHDSPLHHSYAVGRDLPEDPCHPCGCPKRFNRHADGCAYSECPSCGAPADVTGQRIPEHRTGCPQAVTA